MTTPTPGRCKFGGGGGPVVGPPNFFPSNGGGGGGGGGTLPEGIFPRAGPSKDGGGGGGGGGGGAVGCPPIVEDDVVAVFASFMFNDDISEGLGKLNTVAGGNGSLSSRICFSKNKLKNKRAKKKKKKPVIYMFTKGRTFILVFLDLLVILYLQ